MSINNFIYEKKFPEFNFRISEGPCEEFERLTQS